MKHEFSDRLRFCRWQRGLTQEQLAEAMGVSVAAVSKWELGQSVPELETLLELADIFDLSVDALLGFRLRDGGCQEAGARIDAARREKRYDEGAREAEMALQKYPNRFAVVYPAARLFHMAGIERKREPALRRALELLSHACRLLDQNSDPDISETSLRIEMADALLGLGEEERAIAMLRANNPRGVNDEAIGCILAGMAGRREEAMPLLSMALLRHVTAILQIGSKLCNIYEDRGRLDQADEILAWLCPFLQGLEQPGSINCLTKYRAAALGGRAQIAWKSGREQDAEAFLREALALADRFDAAPTTGRTPSAGTRGRTPPWPTTAWAPPPGPPSGRSSPSRGRTRRLAPSSRLSSRRTENARNAALWAAFLALISGVCPGFPRLSPAFPARPPARRRASGRR